MTDRAELKKALIVLEAQRAILGDVVVDSATAPIREQLTALEQGEGQASVALPAEHVEHCRTILRGNSREG
jgi:hypothetical protein